MSHETYDGEEQNVLISLNDAETSLRDMMFLLRSIPYEDINAINDIDKLLDKLAQFKKTQNQLTDENIKNKILNNERERSEYKDEEIDISTINELLSVKKSSRVNFKNKIIKCTILKFKDNHEERIMDEWCDPSGEITKKGGAEIVKYLEKGSAFYAPAASGVQMAESYLKNLKKQLPCAAFLNGEYGFKNIYAGVPVIIGSNGVEKVIEIDLSNEEKTNFKKSIKSVEELFNAAKKIDSTL